MHHCEQAIGQPGERCRIRIKLKVTLQASHPKRPNLGLCVAIIPDEQDSVLLHKLAGCFDFRARRTIIKYCHKFGSRKNENGTAKPSGPPCLLLLKRTSDMVH